MALVLYNTLTKRKEPFAPVLDGKVGMYVCGVTVYDKSHLGHAKSAINFDLIVRYLRHKGYDVRHVTNFTDVDDKIIVKSNETGMTGPGHLQGDDRRVLQGHGRPEGEAGERLPEGQRDHARR